MSKAVNTILAAAAGFAAGILLAPKSGKETRADLKDKAIETKGKIDEKTDEVTKALKKGAGAAETEARGMAESARRSAKNIAGEAVSLGDEARERAGRVVDSQKQPTKK